MSDHDTQQLPPIADAGPAAPPTSWEPPRPGRPRRGYALVAATALVAGALGAGVGGVVTTQLTGDDVAAPTGGQLPSGSSGSAGSTGSQNASARDVAAAVLPSVVSLRTNGGSGSGVILSADGLILTNNHVVSSQGRALLQPDGTLTTSPEGIEVIFNDGRTATAKLVGTDPLTDLAVVKAEGVSGLRPAKLGDSEALAVGDRVLAVGSPLGLSGTVTEGIVSALDRPVSAGAGGTGPNAVIDAIQTDAAVNPGNSGGALVNMAGEVVGINSAIATIAMSPSGEGGSIGLGFAIPIDQAKPIADELADGGEATHARIGVGVRDSVGDGDRPTGALLVNVEAGSPAAKAGLRAGDVVTMVGERRISGADGLIAAVRSHRPGETAMLTFVREGKEETVEIQLASDSPST